MFEDRKIKVLERRNKELTERNKVLMDCNKELESKIENMQSVIHAAEDYRDAHNKMMYDLGEAKIKYELAYKDILKLKKEYETRMNRVLKDFE